MVNFNINDVLLNVKMYNYAWKRQNDILLNNYISIAAIWIERRSSRGLTKCNVFCPMDLQKDFIEFFTSKGFKCEKVYNCQQILIDWSEAFEEANKIESYF